MPSKPLRPCSHPGCRKLTSSARCAEHQAIADARKKQTAKRYDQLRGSAAERGYDARWTNYSKLFRSGAFDEPGKLSNTLCVDCYKRGILTSVEHGGHVDHIIAVTGPDDPNFWEPSNHASRCLPCHSAKTAREDGGLGNPKRK